MRAALVGFLLLLGACGADRLQYEWDDRRQLCSNTIDDSEGAWALYDSQLSLAANHGSVALLHGHIPGRSVSIESIDRVLDMAAHHGLDFVTFAELEPSQPHHGALALCFDDSAVHEWFGIRDLLARYGARVTFFVTRVHEMDDSQLAELHELAAEGHGVEAHSVNHVHATAYVAEHGLDAYLAEEVLPSIQILEDHGFPVTSYAFPFGEAEPEVADAVLGHVQRTRVSPGDCPN